MNFFRNISPFQRVILGLLLGILVGLFFGEPAGKLKVLGDVYIRLLQMTVLPYILVSIIGGLGRLDARMAAKIGLRGGAIVLIVWLVTMLSNLLLPLAYPNWDAAGFFSTSLLMDGAAIDFLELYIPYNIYHSLADTIVPAVVLFSLIFGIALIGVKDKQHFLAIANNIADTLMKVASYVAKTAPIGIFAISAAAAGTIYPEELSKLQIFLWCYLALWALIAFIALPLAIAWASPFGYRQILKQSGEAMVTAFATGTVLVVLPMIAERCKGMLDSRQLKDDETEAAIDVMVPTAYSFPSAGTLMGLGFILFSAWYLGSPLSVTQYPSYILMGTLSAFGSMAVAIPFMLDYFGLPADQFQLYLLGSVVTARFATAMAVLHGFVVSLLVATAVMNRLNWKRLFSALSLHMGVSFGAMLTLGLLLTALIPFEYKADKSFESMGLFGDQAPIATNENVTPLTTEQLAQARLDIVQNRGSLRVGYASDRLPFAYRNDQGQVVGLDIDMMHVLARDLSLSLELYRVKNIDAPAMLNDGRLDVYVGGTAITPQKATQVAFSIPYTHHSLGLLVPDARRDTFFELEQIQKMPQLRMAIPENPYFTGPLEELFPNAEFTRVSSPRAFFKKEYADTDALVYSAEVGAAWTLLYPDYSIVIPAGVKFKAPVGLALPQGDVALVQFMDSWVRLQLESGHFQTLYDYWILGINPVPTKTRWSIMKDVLGWRGRSQDR